MQGELGVTVHAWNPSCLEAEIEEHKFQAGKRGPFSETCFSKSGRAVVLE